MQVFCLIDMVVASRPVSSTCPQTVEDEQICARLEMLHMVIGGAACVEERIES
jgi:hypothetical protein